MRKTLIAIIVALPIAAGWTGLWFYAARVAGQRADAWMAAEAAQGRNWTCPNRTIGGYPFAIALSCSDASFSGQAMGRGVEGSVAHLTAQATLLHPHRLAISLAAPFAYRTSDGRIDLRGTWKSLDADLDGVPDVTSVRLRGTDVAVDGTFDDEGRQGGSAARLDATFTLTPEPADQTIAFAIAMDGAPIAVLDALIGGAMPADIALAGRLDHAAVGDARTPDEALENWRRAGGRITLGPSLVVRGESKVTASGGLGLDAAHRPQGRLDAQFVGLGPILARYGIGGNLTAAATLLNSLFGDGRKAAQSEPGTLALPVWLEGGHLGIGPIRTPIVLPSLY